MGVVLEDELRLAKLRERLEDRPNHKTVTVQVGERWVEDEQDWVSVGRVTVYSSCT